LKEGEARRLKGHQPGSPMTTLSRTWRGKKGERERGKMTAWEDYYQRATSSNVWEFSQQGDSN